MNNKNKDNNNNNMHDDVWPLNCKRSSTTRTSASTTRTTPELLSKWREECRTNLYELEKKSIDVRCSAFSKIISEKTSQVNRMLCITNHTIPQFTHLTEINQHLKFIENWNGLNTNQMRTLPCTLQEYENRAKNWLNGRRAINYAHSLFPEMLIKAEEYAHNIALKIFSNSMQKAKLYELLLIYAFISGICSGRVALYDGHHRASLICENSVKKEGNLKRLLQKYFDGDELAVYSFPKNLQNAIDYFKNKYHEFLNEFQTKYTRRHNDNNNVNNNNNNIVNNQTNNTNNHNHNNNNASYQASRGAGYSSANYRSNPLNGRPDDDSACIGMGGSSGGVGVGGGSNNRLQTMPALSYGHGQSDGRNVYSNNNTNTRSYTAINAHSPRSVHSNGRASILSDHRVSIQNMITKMNGMRQRNMFLEQELVQYKEQSKLDQEKIRLLEESVSLMHEQRMPSYNNNNNYHNNGHYHPSHSSPHGLTNVNCNVNENGNVLPYIGLTPSTTSSSFTTVNNMDSNGTPVGGIQDSDALSCFINNSTVLNHMGFPELNNDQFTVNNNNNNQSMINNNNNNNQSSSLPFNSYLNASNNHTPRSMSYPADYEIDFANNY